MMRAVTDEAVYEALLEGEWFARAKMLSFMNNRPAGGHHKLASVPFTRLETLMFVDEELGSDEVEAFAAEEESHPAKSRWTSGTGRCWRSCSSSG